MRKVKFSSLLLTFLLESKCKTKVSFINQILDWQCCASVFQDLAPRQVYTWFTTVRPSLQLCPGTPAWAQSSITSALKHLTSHCCIVRAQARPAPSTACSVATATTSLWRPPTASATVPSGEWWRSEQVNAGSVTLFSMCVISQTWALSQM